MSQQLYDNEIGEMECEKCGKKEKECDEFAYGENITDYAPTGEALCPDCIPNDDEVYDDEEEEVVVPEPAKTEYTWLTEFSKKEEVLVRYCNNFMLKAIIKKINKKSVTVIQYSFREIIDMHAFNAETLARNRIIWDKLCVQIPFNVVTRGRLIKKGDHQGIYDHLFVEGERYVDYGN